ncbi:hypothetical protein JDN41_06940 [Rhodomicrobium udaipurense]|uniref:Uncharacterized protein n=1 Tax=Rhodomicrobium udaipurense TaxID=1202716 RepID=A0A8I1GE59_9HYPH|nr:hypothetical protein [Rhodomicrobium udaipurense]MBJ7543289.1 hypothetical protein [Rhodomicrobium udaipurense]
MTIITHTCGHEADHDLRGRTRRNLGSSKSQRDWLAKKRAEEICPDCAEKALAEKRAAESAAAAQTAAEAGLPPLVGTPRQVAWAETIRADALTRRENDAEEVAARCAKAAALSQKFDGATLDDVALLASTARDAALAAAGYLRTETSAKWWIDGRSGPDEPQGGCGPQSLHDLYAIGRCTALVQFVAQSEMMRVRWIIKRARQETSGE